jgi:hypothetical protein
MFSLEVPLNPVQEVLLTWLPEHQSVERQPFLELLVAGGVLTITVERRCLRIRSG